MYPRAVIRRLIICIKHKIASWTFDTQMRATHQIVPLSNQREIRAQQMIAFKKYKYFFL